MVLKIKKAKAENEFHFSLLILNFLLLAFFAK